MKWSLSCSSPAIAEPGGVAGEDALLAGDPARHQRGILVGDLLEVVDDAEVDVLRQEVLADAFGDVGVDLVLVEDPGLLVLLEHRAVGVDAPDLDRRVALLQIAAGAGDGAAGADADDEVGDPAVGLLPDLRARSARSGRREFDRLSYWFAFHEFGTSCSSRDDTE